ncbi:type I restriction enzyme HsdR N-terminal domain-containing protein [Flavobacterium sp. 5]|uniref:type I restriction enzyme HsdR N-terminal domain-containing protein n=1 Tax=Flavobacterium sp. 5 TaxID=2035199 RepID=UPI000C2BACE5|nr:type I restriction enzyme HsdR N-terminal domain-containing protein [Flavobacterium sp. 5]PKB15211.1 type I restriction and modification enzyme subunit R-like protein [Flavobacterium sp. 5]
MNQEKWNEICFLLSENIRDGISENDFEQNVIQALRVLDWKEYSGDLQIRPSFPIGASNRITPDIVINSNEKRNLFVIEIKQPNLPLNTKFQQQLFSYMRQLKLKYGVLVGKVIQIFYDGDLTEHEEPVLLETIDFERDSQKGQKFVELFNKSNFSYNLLDTFTENSLNKINRRNEQKILSQKILSPEYELKVLQLIKQDFLSEYDGEIIDNVLQTLSVNISTKNYTEIETIKIKDNTSEQSQIKNERDKTKYIINETGLKLPKNKFVLEFVRTYIKEKPMDFNSLKNIFRDEYQGSTGVINQLDFVETKFANKSNKRHFTGSENILISSDNIKFVVSTEWGKGNIDNIVNLARKEGFKIDEV